MGQSLKKLGSRLEHLIAPVEIVEVSGVYPVGVLGLTPLYPFNNSLMLYDIREAREVIARMACRRGYEPVLWELRLARFREKFDRYMADLRKKNRYGKTMDYCSVQVAADLIGRSPYTIVKNFDSRGGSVRTIRFGASSVVNRDDVLELVRIPIPEQEKIDVDFIYEQLLDKVYLP